MERVYEGALTAQESAKNPRIKKRPRLLSRGGGVLLLIAEKAQRGVTITGR